jgi:hypothetical protein
VSFTLNYPKTTPTHTVVLRDPQIGNVRKTTGKGTIKHTRSGELIGMQVSDHLEIETDNYKFLVLNASVLADLEDFLETSAGAEINIVDHDAADRDGYILSNVFDIVTMLDGDGKYEVNFEFSETVA